MNGGSRQSLGRSFICAFRGIAQVLLHERNAQIEVAVALFVGAYAIFFHISGWQLAAVLLCIFSVLSLEILNSAVEAVVDLASPEPHPLAKRAKDASAGAVLMAALGSAVIGCWIFIPKLRSFSRYAVANQASISGVAFSACIVVLCVYVIWVISRQVRSIDLSAQGKNGQETDDKQ